MLHWMMWLPVYIPEIFLNETDQLLIKDNEFDLLIFVNAY